MENEAARARRLFAAGNLKAGGIAHGFFMRTGGVSEGIYASLNCGRGSADLNERVEENRARVAAKLGVEPAMTDRPKAGSHGQGSDRDGPWKPGEVPEADAVVTNVRGLAVSSLPLTARQCSSADPEAGVVGGACGLERRQGRYRRKHDRGHGKPRRPARTNCGRHRPRHIAGRLRGQPRIQGGVPCEAPANERYFTQPKVAGRTSTYPATYGQRILSKNVANIEDIGACTYKNESFFSVTGRSSAQIRARLRPPNFRNPAAMMWITTAA